MANFATENSPAETRAVDGAPAVNPAVAQAYGLLAPRTAATLPQYLPGFGYGNAWEQALDAHGMANRYTQSWPWGNGAGRFAYGSGAPYGNPAGRNAPWFVTGANGQAGNYPNPGTILGQGQSQIPQGQPGAFTGGQQGGLLGKPQPRVAVDPSFGNGLLAGNTQAPYNTAPGAPNPPGVVDAGASAQNPGYATSPENRARTQNSVNASTQQLPNAVAQWNALGSTQARNDWLNNGANAKMAGDLLLSGLLSNNDVNGLWYDPNYDLGAHAQLNIANARSLMPKY